ncbi:uncharacterized protein PGTG_01048 [Puccinia graminis f. sp. tritici CRL 75-36-700-3]|uniref:Uncharacterized protein n=1 Tax=Puccinia graminis f. sp. tritici (strain CRL 75-36-700-3 / race SCCL) TaxID=418459 RepID=E3JUJ2_PUCGT|nr:uncharacterized protein PGTG_01048 [Puccinia graminis f. sp. tritici CRL 75-36-700-3]EFP75717.2 hypothetical protein PGTG_01048 [Puccinia graminis f. sp. tritici CRL 75-36-700-3]
MMIDKVETHSFQPLPPRVDLPPVPTVQQEKAIRAQMRRCANMASYIEPHVVSRPFQQTDHVARYATSQITPVTCVMRFSAQTQPTKIVVGARVLTLTKKP